MPGAEVLAVPTTVPAAALATPASLRADSGVVTELVALDPRKRQKFQLVSREVGTACVPTSIHGLVAAIVARQPQCERCEHAFLDCKHGGISSFLSWQASVEEWAAFAHEGSHLRNSPPFRAV